MPAEVHDVPLGISCVFSDGSRSQATLGDVASAQLTRDLLTGLAELIHPHGTVDAAGSVRHYVRALAGMVATLAERGFTGGAADLRRAQLAEYWMGTTGAREACTRRMLQGFAAAGGVLDARVAELAEGRAYNLQPYRRPLPPYPEIVWTRLTRAAETAVTTAYRSHKAALAGAGRGQDPCEAAWEPDNLRWLLARSGPMTVFDVAAHLGVTAQAVRRRTCLREVSAELFPHLDVTVAYVLLFSIYSGIVPDGIDDLVTGDIDWAGDASILLSYVKGRTAAESLTLPRRAVRLLEQWLEHSRLLRSFVSPPGRDQLWLGVRQRGHASVTAGPVNRNLTRRWLARHAVLDEEDRPLTLHRHRIRTTHESMRDKTTWKGSGRATIDPNHSPQVEGDHYLTATTAAQRDAVDAIIEDAQCDLARRAQPPVVIANEQAAALARGYPQLVASLQLDEGVLAELIGGQRDVFTAACADQLSGLHGPKGKPCPARPWVCLLCPLAVFAPRHAPNLLRLKAFFSRQWQQMTAAQFMAVFGPYSQRIGEVLDRYDPAVLAAAARQVGDRDDELPLRPEELTT
jgi:hypothetical protein